jgi:hypothetical protein
MRSLLIVAALLAAAGIATLVFLRPTDDGLGRYPHAFIAAPGYDPAAIQFIEAPLETPPIAPPGMATAWVCNDPAFNDAQKRPWLFPLETKPEQKPVLPTHPGLKRRPTLDTCAIYRSPAAQVLLDAYRAGKQKP